MVKSEEYNQSHVPSEDGPLANRLSILLAASNSTELERRHWREALLIAQVLDSKQLEIKAFAADLSPSESFNSVQMGPIIVREPIKKPVAKRGWLSVNFSWSEAQALYQEVLKQGLGADWLKLDHLFQTLLRYDEYRIIHSFCEGAMLSREDIRLLSEVSTAIADFLSDPNSASPQLSVAAIAAITRHPLYSAFAQDRLSWGQLKETIDRDLASLKPTKNDTIIVDINGDLVLPLDPGPFSEVTRQIEDYVAMVWSSPQRRVRIHWTSSNDHIVGLWKMVSNQSTGRHAYVDWESRTIGLFSGVKASVIAHEFGHVIGFPDYYYLSYDVLNCRYVEESNNEEIMSDDSTAVVPDHYWEILDRLYPLHQ